MGRPFKSELQEIKYTYAFSKDLDVKEIVQYIKNNLGSPFLVVGSGGSYSVAMSFSLLIGSLGGIANATTPYELVNSVSSLQNINVIFFSASGSNPDIINAYRFCKTGGAKSTYIICLKANSKLVIAAKTQYHDKNYYNIDLPCGRDGFLAVNSSICAFGILELIHEYVGSIADQPLQSFEYELESNDQLQKCLQNSTIVVLGGHWTMPIVYDFESKCTEAGLIHVLPADLRNFAHGRHHWVAKNPDTSIICFVTSGEEKLAHKTLALFPAEVKRTIIKSNNSGVASLVDLFTKMCHIIQALGEQKGIDPGKPGVPEYGSKLYHLNYNLLNDVSAKKYLPKTILERMVWRKRRICANSSEHYIKCIHDGAINFLNSLSKAAFSGVVFDYDNTVISDNDNKSEVYHECIRRIIQYAESNINICFSTGRGKSIKQQLAAEIPSYLHEKIAICYYNGGIILPLSKDIGDLSNSTPNEFMQINELLTQIDDVSPFKTTIKSIAITIETSAVDVEHIYQYLLRGIIEKQISGIKVLKSDHSIDVVPISSSKLSAVSFLQKISPGYILRIGDAGAEGENDYELLDGEYGLSVGHVSHSNKYCWNIASLGLSGPAATLEYLNNLDVTEDGLRFKESYIKK